MEILFSKPMLAVYRWTMRLAALGFIASALVHLESILIGAWTAVPVVLHVGAMILGVPMVAASIGMGERAGGFSWSEVLRGCPTAMRYAVYGAIAYGMLNVFLSVTHQIGDVQGFSGAWTCAYYVIFAVLYSVLELQGEQSVM